MKHTGSGKYIQSKTARSVDSSQLGGGGEKNVSSLSIHTHKLNGYCSPLRRGIKRVREEGITSEARDSIFMKKGQFYSHAYVNRET